MCYGTAGKKLNVHKGTSAVTIQVIDSMKTVNYSDLHIIEGIGILKYSIISISFTVTKMMMA